MTPTAIRTLLDEEQRLVSLDHLEQAISSLSISGKAALLEARKRVPYLAEKEAPPMRFLRFEHYNVRAAASRLAAYWRIRKDIFGERSLLPINQTGEGTLSFDDGLALKASPLLLLPNEASGTTVVCYGSSHMNCEPDPRHFAATGQVLVETLKERHFTSQGLPCCTGGSWRIEEFERWQETRIRYEWELPALRTKECQDQIIPT
jgi:hypothetical protein